MRIVSDSESSESDDEEWGEIDEKPLLVTFIGEPGIKYLPADNTNILDVVESYFGKYLFLRFVKESNR